MQQERVIDKQPYPETDRLSRQLATPGSFECGISGPVRAVLIFSLSGFLCREFKQKKKRDQQAF